MELNRAQEPDVVQSPNNINAGEGAVKHDKLKSLPVMTEQSSSKLSPRQIADRETEKARGVARRIVNQNRFCVGLVSTTKVTKFPGARAMGLPFKLAVEVFIEANYGKRIAAGLVKKDILHEDAKLYRAMCDYKRRFKKWPREDILSERQVLQRNLEILQRDGEHALSDKQRKAVSRKFRRDGGQLQPSP